MGNNLTNVPTTQLIKVLERMNQGFVEQLIKGAAILCEIRNRKEWHIYMKNGLFRYYSEIHHEKLHPQFAMMFSGYRVVIDAVIGTPLSLQLEWALGGEVDLVEVSDAYQAVEVRKPLMRFGVSDLETAFGPQGLRTIEEQRVIVQHRVANIAPAQDADGPKIRADTKEGVLLIRRARINPLDLREALRDLGWKLVRRSGSADAQGVPSPDLDPPHEADARG